MKERHVHNTDDDLMGEHIVCPVNGCWWNADDPFEDQPWGEQQEQVNHLESRMDEWSPWDDEPDDIDRMGL